MSFSLGSLVRFIGKFESMGQPRDPREVTAVVNIDGDERIYSVARGGVVRRSIGVYSVDVKIDRIGEMSVRFNGDLGFGEATYDVDVGVPAIDFASAPSSSSPSRVDDVTTEPPVTRSEMLETLTEHGIEAGHRSDAYVEAAYARIISFKSDEQSPRDEYIVANQDRASKAQQAALNRRAQQAALDRRRHR